MRSVLSVIVAQRLWQGIAGLVTVAVIGTTLSQEQQGWYYTFVSVAALYSIFEMGLSAALLQLSAHMFVRLHWLEGGRVGGDDVAEFKSFISTSIRAYGFAAIAFVIVSFVVGSYLFGHRDTLIGSALWVPPWALLVTLTGLNMLTLPLLAAVEGSGEVGEVYKVRLAQGLLGAFLCWIVLASGGWLWATSMVPLAGVVVSFFWLVWRRAGLIDMMRSNGALNKFDWFERLWPHQWRLGLNWISVFLMSQLATPILFYYCDPIVAGRMGLSLTVAHMLGIVAQSWIARRVPLMSQAVARREWGLLDQFFRRDLLHSVAIFLVGSLGLLVLYQLLAETPYINRVLPFWQLVGVLGFVFFYHINGALSAQLRSFRREPLVWVSLVGSLLIVPGSIIEAEAGSVGGVVTVMLVTQALLVFPLSLLLWRRYNRIWREEDMQ